MKEDDGRIEFATGIAINFNITSNE